MSDGKIVTLQNFVDFLMTIVGCRVELMYENRKDGLMTSFKSYRIGL